MRKKRITNSTSIKQTKKKTSCSDIKLSNAPADQAYIPHLWTSNYSRVQFETCLYLIWCVHAFHFRGYFMILSVITISISHVYYQRSGEL